MIILPSLVQAFIPFTHDTPLYRQAPSTSQRTPPAPRPQHTPTTTSSRDVSRRLGGPGRGSRRENRPVRLRLDEEQDHLHGAEGHLVLLLELHPDYSA